MLIYDVHPHHPSQVLYNRDAMGQLLRLADSEEAQHVILAGGHGSGKHVLLGFYLETLYDHRWQEKVDSVYQIKGGKTVRKVPIPTSPHHIEITPSQNDSDKRLLLQVIRQYASYGRFQFNQHGRTWKTVVIHDADRLSANSQATLRQTIEKHSRTCRFVLLCADMTPILPPLRSRCAAFCLPLPTPEEVQQVALRAAIFSRTLYTPQLRARVAEEGRQVHRALWRVEEARLGVQIRIGNRETYRELASRLLGVRSGQSPPLLLYHTLRNKIYSILTTVVDQPRIIQNLVLALLPHLSERQGARVIRAACESETAQARGRRAIIIHVDVFLVKVMRIVLTPDADE